MRSSRHLKCSHWSHYSFTLVVVNYMCGSSCPGQAAGIVAAKKNTDYWFTFEGGHEGKVSCQGHDDKTAMERVQTADPSVTGWPALPPQLQSRMWMCAFHYSHYRLEPIGWESGGRNFTVASTMMPLCLKTISVSVLIARDHGNGQKQLT